MNLVRQWIILDGLQLFGRHCQNFDRLTLIELLQPNPLSVSELDRIPVGCCIRRELPERHGLFL
jgi:hypothetical protein